MRPTTNPRPWADRLYPYQEEGVAWLTSISGAAFLGDEMGLGKTCQVIVAADARRFERIFVVAPTSAIFNWRNEFRLFSVFDRRIQVLDTGKVRLDPEAQVVITTPRLMQRATLQHALRRQRWDLVVADEAQAFKTPTSQQTRAFYGEDCTRSRESIAALAENVWLLSGTPVKNHVGELWTHLRALRPETLRGEDGVLLTYEGFLRHYCTLRVTRYGLKPISNRASRLDEVRSRVIRPWMLRRRKEDVLDQLPPIRFELVTMAADHVPAELEKLEHLFQKEVGALLTEIEAMSDAGDDGVDGREFLIRIEQKLDEIPGGLARLQHLTEMLKVQPTVMLVQEHFENRPNEKIIVFGRHLNALAELETELYGWNPAVITGAVTAQARQAAVERFQKDPDCRVFLGQLEACSTAITLTAASEVLMMGSSWSPSDNAQAVARAHRIGQTRTTRARFLALANSIDEAVMRVLVRKTKMTTELFE